MIKRFFINKKAPRAEDGISQLKTEMEALKLLHKQELEKKISEIKEAYLEFKDIKKENERTKLFCEEIKKECAEKIKQKELLEIEYQRIIAEQRAIIEKHKIYVALLESKIHDLSYEIRSLMQIEKSKVPDLTIPQFDLEETFNHISARSVSTYDLSVAIKKCVEQAESFKSKSERKLFGFGNSFALDVRHLFESFSNENGRIVFIFSLHENKMVFANNFVKTALGYSPDRFVKEFPTLFKGGINDWNLALKKIPSSHEEKFKVLLNAKGKKEVLFQGLMKQIKNGPFSGHILGLLTSLS